MQQQSQRCRIAEVSLAFNELDQHPRRRRMALRLGRLFQTHLREQRWRGERYCLADRRIFLNPNQRTLFFSTPSHKQAGSQASTEQEKRQRLRNSRSNRCCQKTMVTAVAIDIVPHDLTGVVDSYGIRA